MAAALPRAGAITSAALPATEPAAVSGNQSTPASGTAAATGPATDSPTARVSTPAPTRSAAWPASIAAPGAVRAPADHQPPAPAALAPLRHRQRPVPQAGRRQDLLNGRHRSLPG